MYIVQPLRTVEEARRIIQFFFSPHVFDHQWAPGEKALLQESVLTSVSDGATHQYWFIEDKGNVIGAIGVNENSYKSGGFEMTDDYMAVHPEYRKKGLATQLLVTTEQFVKKQNGRYILIETCDIPSYAPARAFYEKQGYKKVGEIPDYYNPGEGKIEYYKKII